MSRAAVAGSGAPIAIISGGGSVPLHLAEQLKRRGRAFFIVMLKGEADAALAAHDHIVLDTAQPGRLAKVLRQRGTKDVVMVGSVNGRPDISKFRPDWTTLRLIGRILPALRLGDDALLRAAIGMLEDHGMRVVGAHEIEPDLLAPIGVLGKLAVPNKMRGAIEVGIRAAHLLGALDAGQGVVVIGRRIVALEGAEGTDGMLQRVADLRASGRLNAKKGGVLVKLRKPGQDMRVDLPTIGPQTIHHAGRAGLAGIAVHGENTLVIDRHATIAAADAAGLFLVGLEPANVAMAATDAAGGDTERRP